MSHSISTEEVSPRNVRRWMFSTLAALIWWALLLNQQRLEWSVSPVYAYGWAMPVLVGYLFWMRWLTRPAPARHLPKKVFLALVIGLGVFALPVRVVQEANPDWVKVNWLGHALWVSLVLLSLARAGGKRYAAHFMFPVLFSFAALPWPVWMEEAMMQSLMKTNAMISAEILTLAGTPAMALGNLIQIANQWVNVEEACSGITSLQTAFMMALFLGEFFRLGLVRRLVILGLSFLAALSVNLVRTVILAYLAKSGLTNRWHDTVGNTGMVLCLLLIGLAAWMVGGRRKSEAEIPERPATPSSGERAPLGQWGAIALVAWLAISEGATQSWYRWHERNLTPPSEWTVNLPREADKFSEGQFGERALALLKFNSGVTASWRTEFGHFWQMYLLEWKPGRVSRFLSSSHYPTVCLPATGLTLVAETGKWIFRSGDLEIPFTTYLFDERGKEVYVFHAVIEDRPYGDGDHLSYRQVDTEERLGSVLRGERNLGQRVIGLAVRGPFSPIEARLVVETSLSKILAVRKKGTKA